MMWELFIRTSSPSFSSKDTSTICALQACILFLFLMHCFIRQALCFAFSCCCKANSAGGILHLSRYFCKLAFDDTILDEAGSPLFFLLHYSLNPQLFRRLIISSCLNTLCFLTRTLLESPKKNDSLFYRFKRNFFHYRIDHTCGFSKESRCLMLSHVGICVYGLYRKLVIT